MDRKNKINWKKMKEYLHSPVIITLDDHAMGRDIVKCRCIGWLAEVTHRKIMILSWDVLDECPETRDLNIECISLSKASVTDIVPLKPVKSLK